MRIKSKAQSSRRAFLKTATLCAVSGLLGCGDKMSQSTHLEHSLNTDLTISPHFKNGKVIPHKMADFSPCTYTPQTQREMAIISTYMPLDSIHLQAINSNPNMAKNATASINATHQADTIDSAKSAQDTIDSTNAHYHLDAKVKAPHQKDFAHLAPSAESATLESHIETNAESSTESTPATSFAQKDIFYIKDSKANKDSMFAFFRGAFSKHKDITIPSVKSDLSQIPSKDSFVWLGHSAFMLYIKGKTILFDPIFEGVASPLPMMIRAFNGADIYRADDFKQIDYLLITHNHYDHLSKDTVMALKNRVKRAIVPLGMGRYMRDFGIESHRIVELDWEQEISLDSITFTALPTRHYAMRGLSANSCLWACYAITYQADSVNFIESAKSKMRRIFASGDSGWGAHFRAIGERFGGFDCAFIENGQYNVRWADNHLFPHESLQAAIDLMAEYVVPIHNSKFALAPHFWKQPLECLYGLYGEYCARSDYAGSKKLPFHLLTPRIGEVLPLYEAIQTTRWWET